jgi:hypothetical protein
MITPGSPVDSAGARDRLGCPETTPGTCAGTYHTGVLPGVRITARARRLHGPLL